MKELVISLLEDSEPSRVSTCEMVKQSLKPLIDNKIISVATRTKCVYSKEDEDVCATIYLKLEDCSDKFIGAFQSWFTYKTSAVREIEPGLYRFPSWRFDVCLNTLRSLSCMMHRVSDMEGFTGKIYLKISDFDNLRFNSVASEIEPLPKHTKYFNQFSEFNKYDF